MLGLMNKGGASTPQQQGGNQALAGLFRNNAQAAPGMGMPGQLPQIMPPRSPEIGMPPRPQMPVQAAGPKPIDPRYAAAMEAAKRHMVQSTTAGRVSNDPNGMPRWYGVGGRNAR